MARVKFTVDETLSGKRLDIAILEADVGLSRRKAKAVIDVGGAYVNRRRVRKASFVVSGGDVVELEFTAESLKELRGASAVGLPDDAILYRDADIIAVNKPPGLPSQATKDQSVRHVVPCLQDLLERGGEKAGKLILCHRLDKETSGVILVARNAQAATALTDAFRDRVVMKTYHALVRGSPREERFEVNCHLSEIDKKTGMVTIVRAGGKSSDTAFIVTERFPAAGIALLECHPFTGRSHQIRVHCESKGLPILGDKRYGTRLSGALLPAIADLTLQHHFLHARQVTFPKRGSEKGITVVAPYPEGWVKVLSLLRT